MSSTILNKKFSITSHSNDERPSGNLSYFKDPEAYAGIPSEVIHEDIQAEDDDEHELNLFAEGSKVLPPMSNWFSKFAVYTGGLEPTVDETKELRDKQTNKMQAKQLGTILGVFLPCVQNIFGILLFLRVGWITGVGGGGQAFSIVVLCCCCPFLTALSMSAIATNGKVPAGGSYFMISRSIGPEFGGAVGILFYLGTTMAAAMYLIGAVEVFLKYICPAASLFGDITESSSLFNNTRVYGTVLLILVMCCVLLGIKFVSRFAAVGLVAVIISILAVFIGFFVTSPERSPKVCALGGRLLAQDFITVDGVADCSKNTTGPIYQAYCNSSISTNASCSFFQDNNLTSYPGMPGLGSNKFFENFLSSFYREEGQAYDNVDFPPDRKFGQNPNAADVTTSYMILLAIYFPSVTGIMAGSNRSGDLRNPQVSIPWGTLSAVAVTSVVYFSAPLLFAATCDGAVMRDKFGESYGGGLLVASLAWPHYWVVLIGSCLSTTGAGLQSLTGSPRLLQAIAQDNVMPFLGWFKVTSRRGEPLRAQLLSYVIAQLGILIASIDSITSLVSIFFLMCYGFVNLATMLNGFLKEPSWRPRFRYFHWFLSFIGLMLSVALMFISSWYYTIIAWIIAGAIYKYIEYRGASKEWGDATRGLQMSTATRAIIKLGDKPIHTKNWRPQILVYLPVDENLAVCHDGLVDLVYQLKAGHGLTLFVSVLLGELVERREDVAAVKRTLNALIEQNRIKGLADVLVASDTGEGMNIVAQCAGLGQLRHNTVMISYPDDWRSESKKASQFMSTIRTSQACGLAMLVPKGIDSFPRSKANPMEGGVHVWCIVHDGGLLLLTSYLLMRNRVWRRCQLCIFVVASEGDDVVNLKKDMIKFLYDLRINATVEVVTLSTQDISAYTNQLTVSIEQRRKMVQDMKLPSSKARQDPQSILDQHRKSVCNLPSELVNTRFGSADATAAAAAGRMISSDTLLARKDHVVVNLESPTRAPGRQPVVVTFIDTDQQEFHLLAEGTLLPDTEKNRQLNEFTFSPPHPLVVGPVDLAGDTDLADPEALAGVDALPTEQSLGQAAAAAAASNHVKSSAVNEEEWPRSKRTQRLHNATGLNQLLRTHSSEAALVIVNMPSPSRTPRSEYHYMNFVEVLTDGLTRVLLVRGTGQEVITAFSE